MSFQTSLNQHFPNAKPISQFVNQSSDWLHELGFAAENSLASIGRCRDELTLPLLHALEAEWGAVFDLAALAGMLFAGKTGFSAAIAHAPTRSERKRYLFFAFTHIGITVDGEVGQHLREGQDAPTTACGALCALQAELVAGKRDLTLYPDDIEQSLLRQRLIPTIGSTVPDLVTLTMGACEAISADLQQIIDLTVDAARDDYAVLTGIHIHTPLAEDYIWLSRAMASVDGTIYNQQHE